MGMVRVELSQFLFLLCFSSFIFSLSVGGRTPSLYSQSNGAGKPTLDVPFHLRGHAISEEPHEENTPGTRIEEITLTASNVVLKTVDGHAVNQLVRMRSLLQVPPSTSPPVAQSPKSRTRVSTIIIAVVVSVVSTLLLVSIAFCIYRRRLMRKIVRVREKPLLYGDDSLPVSVDVSATNPKLNGNVMQHTTFKPTPQEGVQLESHDDNKEACDGENFHPGMEVLFDINLSEPPLSVKNALFRYSTMPALTNTDGRAIPDQVNGVTSEATAPTKPSPTSGESSVVILRQQAAADQIGTQSILPNPSLATPPSSFSKIREDFKELGSGNAQKPQPNFQRQKSKFEEVMDPYPVGWKRPSKPKRPDAPIKSSFVSTPTPGPPPLPAPHLVSGLPVKLVEHPDATLPILQDYIQPLEDARSGGRCTPVSPSSPKTEGTSSVCPSKPGKLGDAMELGSGFKDDEHSPIPSLSLPAAGRPEAFHKPVSLNNGADLSTDSDPSTPLAETTPTPPPPPPPPPPPLGIGRGQSPNGISLNTHVRSSPAPPPPPLPPQVRRGSPPPPPPRGGGSLPNLPPVVRGGNPSIPFRALAPLNTSRTSPSDLPNQGPSKQLKPFHWDKVKTTLDNSVVWNKLNTSFQLDPLSLEDMFGIQKTSPTRKSTEKASFSNRPDNEGILDHRKAHNLGIQLRALGLTRVEVCDALLEGEGLSDEILEVLVKVAPSDEEKRKFEEFDGEQARLGPADRFMYAVLSVPNAWLRLEAMLYRAQCKEDLPSLRESLETLKVACKDLKESRTFRKLLEAVLKTGNNINMGTYRGDARAFKLDSLLKLADIKGVDNKTTLLHFVVQEINKSELANFVRLAGKDANNNIPLSHEATGSPNKSDFSASMEAAMKSENAQNVVEYDKMKMPMGKVMGLPLELAMVRKAGGFDWHMLQQSVQKLVQGFQGIKAQVQEGKYKTPGGPSIDLSRDKFQETMENFTKESTADITVLKQELREVVQAVKLVNVYFYGNENDSEPLNVFLIVKQFLIMLEQVCKDVLRAGGRNKL